MPGPELDAIIQLLRAEPLAGAGNIEQMRSSMEAAAALVILPPDVMVEQVDAGGVPAEWVTVGAGEPRGVILYLHGGGYCICSVNTHRDLVGRVARATGTRALLIEYRLAPEHPFPDGLDDAVAAYRWLVAKGASPSDIVIGGDSAGGGLTAATLLALRDAGDALPAGAFCVSPWLDLVAEGESMKSKAEADPMVTEEMLRMMADAYAGSHDLRDPLLSPVFAELAGLPPMLLQVGTAEVLMDDSTRFAERAKAAGVEVTLEIWDDMIHVWHVFAETLPEGQQAIDRIGEWVRERVGAGVPASQK
jgi:acetyl esterase/lipase